MFIFGENLFKSFCYNICLPYLKKTLPTLFKLLKYDYNIIKIINEFKTAKIFNYFIFISFE
jgi:hypothetical protein